MPTYDYRCDRCERTFEVRQRISEAPLTACDRCGGPIHRLLSAAPFILKGGGWYVTDYPSDGAEEGGGGREEVERDDVLDDSVDLVDDGQLDDLFVELDPSSSSDGAAKPAEKPASTPSS